VGRSTGHHSQPVSRSFFLFHNGLSPRPSVARQGSK
jgi:hypothetical protein